MGPTIQENVDKLARVQRRAAKAVRGLEHLPCEERLRKWGLFSPEMRGLWRTTKPPVSAYGEGR